MHDLLHQAHDGAFDLFVMFSTVKTVILRRGAQ
jgi:hypothetical protein